MNLGWDYGFFITLIVSSDLVESVCPDMEGPENREEEGWGRDIQTRWGH